MMLLAPTEVFGMHTTTVAGPVATHTYVSPIPSIVPDSPEFQRATAHGQAALWVGFGIMLFASLAFTALSWRVPVSKRLFHILMTMVTIVSAISYFGMASRHAITWHHIKVRQPNALVPDVFHHIYRQIFWARYVDWAITSPLLLLNLGFLAGLSGAHILIAVAANLIMVLTALFSRFGAEETPQKWGWYVMSLVAYLTLLWQLVVNGRTASKSRGKTLADFYVSIASYLIVVLTVYPVIWGVVGGLHLSVDGEIIAYCVLDTLAKPVFGAWILYMQSKAPSTNVELDGVWTFGVGTPEGRVRLDDGA